MPHNQIIEDWPSLMEPIDIADFNLDGWESGNGL
jgi:hypothetical protein